MKTDIVQKCFLFNTEGNILLLRRSETDIRRPLQWDFPGGVLDPGESLEHGIIREIREESSIDVLDVHVIFSKTELAEWFVDTETTVQRNVVRLYYTAHTVAHNVTTSDEHSEYCWVTLKKALDLLEYPRHKEVIKWAIDNKIDL